MTSQAWDRAQAPRSQGPALCSHWGSGCGPAQRCPHQGFFTVRPSSCRKPFCSIHLSLRNLDLQESGGQQGLAESHHRLCPHQGAQFPQKAQDPSQTPPVQGRAPRGWLELQEEAWEPDCREPVGISCPGGIWSTREEELTAQTVLSWNLCHRPPRAPWAPPPTPPHFCSARGSRGAGSTWVRASRPGLGGCQGPALKRWTERGGGCKG